MRIGPLIALVSLAALVGCSSAEPTSPPMGYEMGDQDCEDQIDNDQDGMTDCQDPDCLVSSVHCGERVPLVSYLEPEGSPGTCDDQVDNDDNGQFDCGDAACQLMLESCCLGEVTDASCSDGVDNDGNGYTDCEDRGCYAMGLSLIHI